MYFVIKSQPYLEPKVVGSTKFGATEEEGKKLLRSYVDDLEFPQSLRLCKVIDTITIMHPNQK